MCICKFIHYTFNFISFIVYYCYNILVAKLEGKNCFTWLLYIYFKEEVDEESHKGSFIHLQLYFYLFFLFLVMYNIHLYPSVHVGYLCMQRTNPCDCSFCAYHYLVGIIFSFFFFNLLFSCSLTSFFLSLSLFLSYLLPRSSSLTLLFFCFFSFEIT